MVLGVLVVEHLTRYLVEKRISELLSYGKNSLLIQLRPKGSQSADN